MFGNFVVKMFWNENLNIFKRNAVIKVWLEDYNP